MTLVEAAIKDLGQKAKPGDVGFVNKNFERALKDVGWPVGWSWCSYVLAKWLREANPEQAAKLDGFFVASAMGTFRNLKNEGIPISMVPTVGAFVFWQRIEQGSPLWHGHAGIVSRVVSGVEFFSIEGNTQPKGAEVSAVLERHRFVKRVVFEGLKVIGFITV